MNHLATNDNLSDSIIQHHNNLISTTSFLKSIYEEMNVMKTKIDELIDSSSNEKSRIINVLKETMVSLF